MPEQIAHHPDTAAAQLRPVVIAVVALKLSVFALLMTTLNLPTPSYVSAGSVEIAAVR